MYVALGRYLDESVLGADLKVGACESIIIVWLRDAVVEVWASFVSVCSYLNVRDCIDRCLLLEALWHGVDDHVDGKLNLIRGMRYLRACRKIDRTKTVLGG